LAAYSGPFGLQIPASNSATAQLRLRSISIRSRSTPGSPSSSTDVGNHSNYGPIHARCRRKSTVNYIQFKNFKIHEYRERDNIAKYIYPKATVPAQTQKKISPFMPNSAGTIHSRALVNPQHQPKRRRMARF
jgi:hypothetical protein